MAVLEFILGYIGELSYFAIFVLFILGGIGVPLPEEIILLVAGYVAFLGTIHIAGALIVSFAGVLVSDLIGYWIGRRGGKLLTRFLSKEKFKKMESYFKKHGGKTIFLSRFMIGVRVFFPVVAGMTRMRFREFLYWEVLATAIWVPIVVLIGFFFGAFLPTIVDWVKQIDLVISVVFAFIVLLALFAIAKRKTIKHKWEQARHNFFTKIGKGTAPLECLQYGDPFKIGSRVFTKRRKSDKKVKIFIQFTRDGKNAGCLHSRKWLTKAAYQSLKDNWKKTLGKPKRLSWPKSKSSRRRSLFSSRNQGRVRPRLSPSRKRASRT